MTPWCERRNKPENDGGQHYQQLGEVGVLFALGGITPAALVFDLNIKAFPAWPVSPLFRDGDL